MRVTAFILSLIAGVLSILHSCAGAAVGAIGSGLSEIVHDDKLDKIKGEAGGMVTGAFFIFVAAIIAFVGGSFALKGRKLGWILLTISAVFCLLVGTSTIFKDGLIYGSAYAISAMFGILGRPKKLATIGAALDNERIQPQTQTEASAQICVGDEIPTSNINGIIYISFIVIIIIALFMLI